MRFERRHRKTEERSRACAPSTEGRRGCSFALRPQQRRWPDIEPGHPGIQVRAIGSCLFLFVLAALLAGALPLLILILLLLTLVVPLLLTLLVLLVLLTLLILVAHVSSPLTASALMLTMRLSELGLCVR